jgi:hypothetical protein
MRHSVHHVPIQIGWMMMKKIDTTPSGTIITPNSRTSHGIVRQRRCEPITPVRISSA